MAVIRQAPRQILLQTGLTGTLANIQDDPTAPDGNTWLTAPVNTATELRVNFPQQPGMLKRTQSFRLWVRRTAHTTAPTMTVFLLYNGVQQGSALLTTTITTNAGVLHTVNWTPTSTTQMGTHVQLRITGTPGGGASNQRASLEIGAVDWLTDYDPTQFTVWDGTAELTIFMDGTWNGTAIVPTTVEGVTT